MDRFGHFLVTADDQFGFKKGLGCNNAIYYVRNVVEEHFTSGGSTVNVCALHLSKAFYKVNHNALFNKLMKRNIPSSELLCILENWFANC